MNMSMGFRFEQKPMLKHELKQVPQLRLTCQNILSVPFEVLCRRAKTNTICPHCWHKLTYLQVKNGFSNDAYDILCKCPKCDKCFSVNIKIILSDIGSMEFPWVCPRQLAQMVHDELNGRKISKKNLKGRFNLAVNMAKNFPDWNSFVKYYKSIVF